LDTIGFGDTLENKAKWIEMGEMSVLPEYDKFFRDIFHGIDRGYRHVGNRWDINAT